MVTTCRCRSGSAASARSTWSRDSLASATLSGVRAEASGTSSSSGWGTVLASRAPRVLARLTRIVNVQPRSDERPSNPATPLSIPSQASWTTSSADCALPTKDRAMRSMAGDHCSTSWEIAASSRARISAARSASVQTWDIAVAS